MGFKEVQSLDADVVTALGGVNTKTNKPNPKTLEGYYLGNRQVESKMSKTGFAKLHFFQTSTGNVGVWGKTDLDRKLAAVALGTMTRATHTGMQPVPGKRPMYKYKVELDESNTIEVAVQEETSLQGQDVDSGDAGYDDKAYDGLDDGPEDTLDGDDTQLDEIQPPPPRAPQRAAQTPSAAQQAKVKELLGKNKNRTA